MTAPEHTGPPDRGAALLCAVPALIVALAGLVGALLVDGWRVRLPDPVASHWSSSGPPDGFMSVDGVIVSVAVTAGIGAVLCLVVFVRRVEATTRRILAGTICGTAVFVIVLIVALTGAQLDLAHSAAAPLSGWAFLFAAVGGVLAGTAAGFVVPAAVRDDSPPVVGQVPVAAPPAGPGVLWSGRTTYAPAAMIVLASSVLALLATAVVTGMWPILLPVALVIALATVATGLVRVTVSAERVRFAGPLGRPRVEIPLAEIERAEVVPVSALKDFGGWGIRVGFSAKLKGAVGFVLRSGPGLVVVRTGDSAKPFRRDVVVVDDAATAAAFVNALLDSR